MSHAVDLTREDVHVLLICLRGSIAESKNEQFIADAKALKTRLENIHPLLLPSEKPPSDRRRRGEVTEYVRIAIQEMPATFTARDVSVCLKRLNASVKDATLHMVLQPAATQGRGPFGIRYSALWSSTGDLSKEGRWHPRLKSPSLARASTRSMNG